MKKSAGAKAAVGLAFLALISKVLGFIREIVISYMYGASAMSDAYSMANSVAVLIITGLASGIMTAYIPMAMEIHDGKERDVFASNILNTIVMATSVIAIVCIIFSRNIVSVLGMGFSESTKEYTAIILRFIFISSICIFIIYIITAILNTKGNFSFGGWQLIITNLIFIFAVILSGNNAWNLGIGYFLAYLIPTIIAICVVKKYGFVYSPKISFRSRELKNLLLVSLIAFLGTNVIKFDIMIDRIFASNLQEGTVAAVNYAFTLISIFPEVFILSMATVGYPRLSEYYSAKNEKEFGVYISNMIIQTVLILLPITLAFLEMGKWGVEIMFQRGAFNARDTLLTTNILYGYSYSMLGIGMSYILCRAFFARKEEWIPALSFGFGIVLNMGLNISYGKLGAYELALTTSISVFVSTIIMLICLLFKVKKLNVLYLMVNFGKILAASVVMFFIMRLGTYIFGSWIEGGSLLIKVVLIGSVVAVAGVIYLLILYLCKVDEVKVLISRFEKKIKKEKAG